MVQEDTIYRGGFLRLHGTYDSSKDVPEGFLVQAPPYDSVVQSTFEVPSRGLNKNYPC